MHSSLYCRNLRKLLIRVKHGGEAWIKRLWTRLTQQYSTSCESVMAEAMKKVMTESGSSGLYQIISFDMNKIYTGLCNERPMVERFVEHLTQIRSHVQTDEKYKGMKKNGGAKRKRRQTARYS